MSNVIGFKAYKNTLKRDSGYAPVSGENGYSVIRCVFPVGGDWDNISAVSAGFFVHPKNIAGVTAAITAEGEERAALFTIPGALLKQGERLHFGLFATVGGVTIATNTVALDVERGIVSDDIDYDPAEAAGMFEQFSNALNTALLGKANKAAAGSAGELAALDGNGSPIRSGVSVIQSIGEGSNSRVPTTAAVKTALDGKADKAAAGTAGELAALDGNGALKRSGVTVAQSVGEGSADKVPTTEAVKTALDGKADKLVNGDVAFTDRILIASNNGGIKNSGYTINNARLSGDVNLTVPSSNVVAIALEGKADKAADGTAGELAALDGNGALKRSGVTVAQSVGEGSADKVPTTEAVRNALNDAEDTTAENIDSIFQGNSAFFPQLYFEQYFTANGSNYRLIYDDRDGERHVLFDFAQLPAAKGEKGDKGDAGRGVTSFSLNNGILTANFDDRTSQTIGNVKGPQGAAGADGYSPTVSTTNLDAQTLVTVTDKNGAHNFYVKDGSSVTNAAVDENGDLIISIQQKPTSSVHPTIHTLEVNAGHVVGAAGAKGDKGDKGDTGNDYVLTAQDKADIAGMVNISGKADKATTLAGYGINDAYTKAEVTALNSAKVDKADYTEVVQEIAEEVGDLKSALDATDADINKLIGNIQCSWKQGGMAGSTGIEYASNSRIITPFIKVKNGDTLQIENPDTSNTLVMSILEFSSNTITSVGVNELIAINYANSTVHSLKLNNSTNYIRLQLNTGDITKGNDMLLYTKDSIVFETIEERNKAIADAIENMSELTLDYPDTGNGYINQNGILVNSDRFYTTGYINATGKLSCIGTIKWLSSDFCYINCYDINKVFLGGVIQGGGSVTYTAPTQITLPNKTAYIRVTKDASAYNNMRFFCADSTTLFSFMPRLADRCLSFIVNSSRSINIKLIGDSITAGLRGTGYNATSTGGGSLIYDNVYQNVEGHCWANSFKAYLEEKFNVSVTNNGVSGIGAGTMINHWNDLVSASDDVVICMIGTNNRASSSSLSEFIGYLEQIVTLANNGNKLLIFMANIPASVANETENKNFHMEDVEHAIRYITDKYNIPFVNVYKLFIEYCINTGVTIDSLLDDGLHPNDAGYDVIFYLICNAFGLATKRPGATW